MRNKILSFEQAEEVLTSFRSSRFGSVVSFRDPGSPLPKGFEDFPRPKFSKEFRDTKEGWMGSPTKQDIQDLISFLSREEVQSGGTLFHCAAGISRSSAGCLIKYAIRNLSEEGPLEEKAKKSVIEVFSTKHMIFPNSLMIKYADEILGFQGYLSQELERMKNSPSFDGKIFI